MINLKYSHTDTGFCRVYFKEIEKPHRLYCIQDEGQQFNPQFIMCRCDKDYEEPDYAVKMELFTIPQVPNPSNDMEKQINELTKNLQSAATV